MPLFSKGKDEIKTTKSPKEIMSLGGEIQWYDIWMPVTSNIPPMLTDQIAAGYFRLCGYQRGVVPA